MVGYSVPRIKKISKTTIYSLAAFIMAAGFLTSAYAVETSNTKFQVNVGDSLSVSLTSSDAVATGELTNYDTASGKWYSNLLRSKVSLSISSNSPAGVTASMTSSSDTTAALTNTVVTTNTIPTLTAAWTRSNTSDTLFWGYSVNDDSETGTYNGIALKNATPNTILTGSSAGTLNKDIYFGAKADSTVASGTYVGTVVISVVTGTITGDNPVIPTDPVTPSDATPTPTYDGDQTVYSATTSNSTANTTTNTTKISKGDTTESSYADPAGVTTTAVNEGTPLATGLAVTAAIAATTGFIFLIAAKRRKDDEEEER